MDTFASLHQYGDVALFMLRGIIATIFIVHGIWKLQNGAQMATGLGKPHLNHFFTFLGAAETLGAFALLSGFLTQLAAAGLGIIMLGALYLKIFRWKVPFTSHDKSCWEFDLMILAGCLTIFVMGAGKIALDRTIFGLF